MRKCFKKGKTFWRKAACLGLAVSVLAASSGAYAAESVVLRPSGEVLSINEAVSNAKGRK